MLSFGWKAREERESHWPWDPAFGPVPDDVIVAWRKDGDASHLRPFLKPGSKPTVIKFRVLDEDEKRDVTGVMIDNHVSAGSSGGLLRAWLRCFRIGVSFADSPTTQRDAGGADQTVVVRERGIRMLASEFVAHLQDVYPGIVETFGRLVYEATFASEQEKKASSQPSTQTPSSEPTAPQPGTAA